MVVIRKHVWAAWFDKSFKLPKVSFLQDTFQKQLDYGFKGGLQQNSISHLKPIVHEL